MACRSSIFCTSRATNWPTSSIDEHQRVARLAAGDELGDRFGELAGVDVGLALVAESTRSRCRGRCSGSMPVHRRAGLGESRTRRCPCVRPSLSADIPEGGLELIESAVAFEADLELGEIEILGVAEAAQEQPVHDLGQRLVAAADTAVGRDVEDDRVGGDLLGDLVEQDLDLVVGTCPEPLAGRLCRRSCRFSIARPSILAKLDLPEPKKPDTQTPMPSWGLLGVSA